jgi:DNA-binding response OmpR family regulator
LPPHPSGGIQFTGGENNPVDGAFYRGMTPLKTILLVDDDLELREMVVAILSEPGHTVLTAADGYEALRVLVERAVDLLITDLKMPGITGFELARQAKLMRPNLHVIYVTGQDSAIKRTGGRTYGMLIHKPVRARELIEIVDREMGRDPGISSPLH